MTDYIKRPKHYDFDKYFNKTYRFKRSDNWKIPPELYTTDKWSLPTLQEKKKQLNEFKELLEKYDIQEWSNHTKSRDPSTALLKLFRSNYSLQFLTQAWCKFYEILSRYKLIPFSLDDSTNIFKTLHLCEAPGAFVCSLNHYLATFYPNTEWNWTASTLNPYYEGNSKNEMIVDDRFIRVTFDNWDFGNDLTGNITSYENHDYYVNKFLNANLKVVTADGSVDCMTDPGNQEILVEFLHYCETITALRILDKSGNFVLKIFTTFEESTVCLLYLLNCLFQEVNIFKPLTSKSGNSEVYVICLNYLGKTQIANWDDFLLPYKSPSNKSMFKLEDIPSDFLEQIHESSQLFMEWQIEKIGDNIECFGRKSNPKYLKRFNKSIKEYWLRYNSIVDIPLEKHIKCYPIDSFTNQIKAKIIDNLFYYIFRKIRITDPEINLKIGKKLTKILHSNYTSNKKLVNFSFKRTNSKLYNIALYNLNCKYNIINITHMDIKDISKFHYTFLLELKNFIESNSRDIIIIGPFITNIQVGILYLLASKFKTIYFFNIGCVVFHNLPNNSRNELLKEIYLIENEYNNLYNPEKFDLLQIVNFTSLIESDLLTLVCKYNNNFAKYWQLL